jgi:hypothetical protein
VAFGDVRRVYTEGETQFGLERVAGDVECSLAREATQFLEGTLERFHDVGVDGFLNHGVGAEVGTENADGVR